jgi:hypothetical protein
MSQAAIVRVENGQVKVFNSAGSGLYSWGTGTGSQKAVSAVLSGDEIHVTRADGWVVICTHSGSQKRMVK